MHRILKKCKHFDKRIWCGYLGPVEVLALRDAGCQFTSKWAVERAESHKRQGRSDGNWVYFQPTKEIEKELR